jgi:TonB-linked SusC/RagA family outer membrane protein
MEIQNVEIAGRSVINIAMAEDLKALGEVIVLGYSTRGKNQITGSTVQVSAEELKNIPVTSIDAALQGKVAGMVVNTTSGSPGAVQQIRIRGIGSMAADNSPLFVIDGVPVLDQDVAGSSARSSLSSLASLNSNDIESVTVLKDASATSAYGARGSNGVIVITTNKGKSGKTKFSLNTSYGFQNKATEGRATLTAEERFMLYKEGLFNSNGVAWGVATPDEAYVVAQGLGYGGTVKYDAWIANGRPYGDWAAAVLTPNAPTFNVSLSASGGDDIQSFYTSFSYLDNEAVTIGNEFKRMTYKLNYNRSLSDKIKFSTDNSVSHTNQDHIFLETSAYFANPHAARYFGSPLLPPRNADGTPNLNLEGTTYNHLYLYDHNEEWNKMTRFTSNTSMEWEIIDKLKFRSVASFDFILGQYKSYGNRIHGDSFQENGTSAMSIDQDFNMVFQNSLDYSLTMLDDHRFDFKALIEFQEFRSWFLSGYGENFADDQINNIATASANFDASSSFGDWMNLSYLGMVNYTYQGKYIVDLTYRREGSSRFAADQRFGNFWAVGAAWNLTQENFMAGVSFVDNLRLRGSYGVSGNSGVGTNVYQALLSYTATYADVSAITPSGWGNASLTWEKNKNYDIGVDFAVLDNRLEGQVSYFNKETFDLLQNVPVSQTQGFNSRTMNVGTMVNKGIEALLDISIIRGSDFNLSMSANFATLDNEITKLAKDEYGEDINITGGATKVEVGHKYNEWYTYEWAGVDPATGLPQWYLDRTVDETLTGSINAAKRNYTGKSAIPTYSGGAGLHADFKGVYFDVNIYVAGGNQIMEEWDHYTWDNGRYVTESYNGVRELLTRWQKPGDITNVPKFQHAYRPQSAVNTSTRNLYDGDYMRLKDLVLGYNLPSSLTSKAKISSANIYVRGTNLFTYAFDPGMKNGFDPEVQADGFTGLETPQIKSVIFGLNLNF